MERIQCQWREWFRREKPTRPIVVAALAAWAIVLTPLIIALSKPAPVVILVFIGACLGLALHMRGMSSAYFGAIWRDLMSTPGLLSIAGVGWLGVSLFWSHAPARGLEYTLHMAGFIILAAVSLSAAKRSLLWPFGGVFLIFLALASFWLIIDAVTDHALVRRIGIAHTITYSNRSAVALSLWMPLAFLLVQNMRGCRKAGIIIFVLMIFAVLLSSSQSAQLAMVAGLISLGLLRLFSKSFGALCGYAAAAAVFLAPWFISIFGYAVPVTEMNSSLYRTVTVRVHMWQVFANLIQKNPWRGSGAETSYVVADTPLMDGLTMYERGVAGYGHPHSAPLQIWFELGIPGAAIMTALVYYYFRMADRLDGAARQLALIGGIQALAVAFVSHGAWQVWWYCLLTIVAISVILWLRSQLNPDASGANQPAAALELVRHS